MFMIFKLLQISLIHLLLVSSNIHKKPIKLAKSLQEVPFSSSKYNHNMNYVNRTACIIHANRIILIQNLLVFFSYYQTHGCWTLVMYSSVSYMPGEISGYSSTLIKIFKEVQSHDIKPH